ncbi:expressed unknown protein [Ectocarpus siliculosus]|uniref:tRNA/rRNA methyltransferase SpoU type domain-containing protein n=1 Tax=Ectocarpus siliculosus TaxID=2880 RepID=D7FX90_ECTSI|nr:expressed unknown protein [Ectocarpus siliculosus]|eukprot:CBJ49268.1 expressed unknown protein [Ectocarpus siliculosus]
MAVNGHDCSMTPTALLAQVFELADGSDHTPETTNSTLFRKLLRKYFSDEAGSLRSGDMIHRACGELWSRLAEMEGRAPDGWASIVVTSLFLLTAKDCTEELVMHMWRIVAHPAEEKYDNGPGRKLMRQAAVAGGTAEHGARSLHVALMSLVVDTLRRNGCPPEPDSLRSSGSSVARGGTEEENEGSLVPSPCGLRLALDVASHTLGTFLHHEDGEGRCVPPEVSAEVFEAWRRDVHLEVVRLVRSCRLENINELVLSIARPLYQGWGDVGALEDVWSLIASSGEENVELYLALLCILGEDLRPVLDVPKVFGLIYSGVSTESALCRRRGLHVLQQVLAWADDDFAGAAAIDVGGGGEGERGEGLTAQPLDPSPPRRLSPSGQTFSREALLQWKDYVRCLQVLCEETELHLVDQVVPTLERLCSNLSPPPTSSADATDASPKATEFRSAGKATLLDFSESVTDFLRAYVAALPAPRVTSFLALLLEAIRRRAVGSIGALCSFLAAFDQGGASVPAMGRELLYQLKETLLVVLPPLNQAKRVLFLDGVVRLLVDYTDFEELAVCYSQPSLCPSLGLVTSVLSALPLELARDRYLPLLATWVGRLPLGPDAGTPLVVASVQHGAAPLLGLFTRRLEAFLGRSRSTSPGGGGDGGPGGCYSGVAEGRSLCLLGLVLSEGLVLREDRDEILAGGLSPLVRVLRKCWHEPYVSPETVEAALVVFGAWAAVSDDTGRDYEGEAGEEDGVGDGGGGGGGGGVGPRGGWWRWRPLEATVSEVVTLVAARLVSLMEEGQEEAVTAFTSSQRSCEASGGGDGGRASDESATGRDAQVLLMALDAAAAAAAAAAPWGLRGYHHQAPPRASAGPASSFSSHPSVVALGGKCVSLLSAGGGGSVRLPPTTHLLAIASLEVIVRARGGGGGGGGAGGGGLPAAGWDEARCKEVALSLLLNKVEGRVTSSSTGKGSNSEWGNILKQHELRKWSCLSALLPVVFGESGATADQGPSVPAAAVCDALVEGVRTSSREEMPLAMACFRTVFPVYVQALPGAERAAAFERIFEVVWGVFKEVRRPQLPLVRNLVSAVLHPSLLAVPELTGLAPPAAAAPAAAPAAQGSGCAAQARPPEGSPSSSPSSSSSSCVVEAFSAILEFGASNNKSNVLRAVVGMLTVHGRQSPGSLINLVPGLVELLLFKERGQGIENLSNGEGSSAAVAAEAPRFMLLLFVEKSLIASAAIGDQGARAVLGAITVRLMEVLSSKEARQAGITDPVAYGRKLRAWQALCVLCGYFCDKASSDGDGHARAKLAKAISEWFWPVHGRTALPPVRQHMEVFAVRMCRAYPDLFLTAVVKELKDFRLPGQVLCSLLIIAGHTLLGNESGLSARHRVPMFRACLPWVVGTHVMGRLIAQLFCHSVLPEFAATASAAGGGGDSGNGVGGGATRIVHGEYHLQALFDFLHDNPEMIKMRRRQLEAFGQTDCEALCTVEGMLEAHGTGAAGEITPTHMCELFKETMDEIWNEALVDKVQVLEDGRAWLQTAAAVNSGAWFEEEGGRAGAGAAGGGGEEAELSLKSGGGGGGDSSHIQQKIIPWDTLDLTVASATSASLEQSTAAGRVRQPVVMCASLVDKMKFHRHLAYTLVLGRENSGLPLDVIGEMDVCCQIPQQGVLRSLNAHVSGAIILAEYSRQMLVDS